MTGLQHWDRKSAALSLSSVQGACKLKLCRLSKLAALQFVRRLLRQQRSRWKAHRALCFAGGLASILLWGAKGSRDIKLPITVGPLKGGEKVEPRAAALARGVVLVAGTTALHLQAG